MPALQGGLSDTPFAGWNVVLPAHSQGHLILERVP